LYVSQHVHRRRSWRLVGGGGFANEGEPRQPREPRQTRQPREPREPWEVDRQPQSLRLVDASTSTASRSRVAGREQDQQQERDGEALRHC
jgi:hypothetical protein